MYARHGFGYICRVSSTSKTGATLIPRVGAHVGSSGGISKAIDRAREIGANCLQIFASAPQQWRSPAHPDAEVEAFCTGVREHDLAPIFLHAVYLLNPASPDPDLRGKSVRSMREYLSWGERLGARGVVVHLGSSTNTTPKDAVENLCRSLDGALQEPSNVPLLLETSAGTRNSMGSSFAAIGSILKQLDAGDRMGVCVDTAHIWAAGYDIATSEGLQRTLDEFESEIGLEKLVLMHANDSKVPLGAARDRHENIGEGYIGMEGWSVLLSEPALRAKPWVMETPGPAKKGPDTAQVDLLRRIWFGAIPALAS